MLVAGTFEIPRESDKGYRFGKYIRKESLIARINCSSVFGTTQKEGVPRLRALLALDSRGTHSAVGIFWGSCRACLCHKSVKLWRFFQDSKPSGGAVAGRRVHVK
eukprot:scaffold16716_cov146-Skeletonema_dohrnii-CCMP3373.AAC.25